MLHQHHEVRVEAPVEHVWGFYCDTSRWPECWGLPLIGRLLTHTYQQMDRQVPDRLKARLEDDRTT